MTHNIRVFLEMLRIGRWSCGWERWEGKPMLDVSMTYYDGYWFAVHIGPFWVQGEL